MLKVEYWPVFRFAIEIHPTGEVSAYTATVDYEYENKVDTVTFGLKAEGKALFNKIDKMPRQFCQLKCCSFSI